MALHPDTPPALDVLETVELERMIVSLRASAARLEQAEVAHGRPSRLRPQMQEWADEFAQVVRERALQRPGPTPVRRGGAGLSVAAPWPARSVRGAAHDPAPREG